MERAPDPIIEVALVPRSQIEQLAAAIAELQVLLATLQAIAKGI
jgi:hypothetical protein